jgi:hypothetical protein
LVGGRRELWIRGLAQTGALQHHAFGPEMLVAIELFALFPSFPSGDPERAEIDTGTWTSST